MNKPATKEAVPLACFYRWRVEDKIIQLQERKRILAKELIADDAGFVKRLTRDDIEYLFS